MTGIAAVTPRQGAALPAARAAADRSRRFGNEVLDRLQPADLERLAPYLRRAPLVQGDVLYEPGDEADRVYFPERGLLSLVAPMRDGSDVETVSRGRDGAMGYVEACGSGVMGSRVVVQIGGVAWRLGARRLKTVLETSPTLQAQLHRRAEFLLAEARQSIACQAVHRAPARLARLLLETSDHIQSDRFPLTQDYIASMLGVGRTTVTHAAGELKRRRIIRYTRGQVTIADPGALRASCCECYTAIREIRWRILGADGAGDRYRPGGALLALDGGDGSECTTEPTPAAEG